MSSDVLIHTTADEIDHKRRGEVPDDHLCFWTVNGTPRPPEPGRRVYFEVDGRLVACGEIREIETGKLWFDPLESVDREPPIVVPSRGFTYVEPIADEATEVSR